MNVKMEQVARYILWLRGSRSMGLGKLHNLMGLAQIKIVMDTGHPIFREPMYAVRSGFMFRDISADWLRRERARMRRGPRRQAALRARVRRWAIQEERRRGGRDRCHRLNIPGGWSEADAVAQRAGIVAAWGEP